MEFGDDLHFHWTVNLPQPQSSNRWQCNIWCICIRHLQHQLFTHLYHLCYVTCLLWKWAHKKSVTLKHLTSPKNMTLNTEKRWSSEKMSVWHVISMGWTPSKEAICLLFRIININMQLTMFCLMNCLKTGINYVLKHSLRNGRGGREGERNQVIKMR